MAWVNFLGRKASLVQGNLKEISRIPIHNFSYIVHLVQRIELSKFSIGSSKLNNLAATRKHMIKVMYCGFGNMSLGMVHIK